MRRLCLIANRGFDTRPLVLLGVLLLASSAYGCGSGWKETSSRKTIITVCDVFKDLGARQGKLIQVRGIYYNGLRDISCEESITMSGRNWPQVLDLVTATLPGRARVGLETDMSGWDEMNKAVIRQGLSKRRGEVWVTVTGILNASQSPDRHTITGGFGHLGARPAEIIVKSISDVVIKDVPTYDYWDALPPQLKAR